MNTKNAKVMRTQDSGVKRSEKLGTVDRGKYCPSNQQCSERALGKHRRDTHPQVGQRNGARVSGDDYFSERTTL